MRSRSPRYCSEIGLTLCEAPQLSRASPIISTHQLNCHVAKSVMDEREIVAARARSSDLLRAASANAPYGPDSALDMMGNMITYKTSINARVLFVGINPHPGSYRRGVPFSNNKTYLLNRSGLLEEAESDLKDDRLLKTNSHDKKVSTEIRVEFPEPRRSSDGRCQFNLKHGEEQAGIRGAKNHSAASQE